MPNQILRHLTNANFEITAVASIGPGDRDVMSLAGRITNVAVTTTPIEVSIDGDYAYFTVIYEIKETVPDFTTLRHSEIVKLFTEAGTKIIDAGAGTIPVNYEQGFPGLDHNWHDVSDQIQGTYMTRLQIKFDGYGDDDMGNAALMAAIDIPVTLEVP